MPVKKFPIESVAGVATGIVLVDRGMSGIHEVMDHLFPGIMTIGCAAMQPAASAEMYRQHPKLVEFVRVNGEPKAEGLADWVQNLRIHFGSEVDITGPLDVHQSIVESAFAALRQ